MILFRQNLFNLSGTTFAKMQFNEFCVKGPLWHRIKPSLNKAHGYKIKTFY